MIAILGRGNVASHLYEKFKTVSETVLVNPHTLENLPSDPDIIIISVSDSAIAEVAEKLPNTDALIVHTAGSVPMDVLRRKNEYGVFYPLQTFTKGVALDYKEIPVFIEASSIKAMSKLKHYASLFTNKVIEADSIVRKKLHLASVFACNFTNALAGIAEDILRSSGLTPTVMLPLMYQTIKKLENLPPDKAQTGPAKRGDMKVINSHLDMLENNPEYKEVYNLLTNLIIKKNETPNTVGE